MNEIAVGDRVQVNGEGPVWTVYDDHGEMYVLIGWDEDRAVNVVTMVWKPPAEGEDVLT